MNQYRPGRYSGRVTLVLATEPYGEKHSNCFLSWIEVAEDGLEMHLIDGEHLELFKEPMIAALADKLTACNAAASHPY